MNKQIYYVYEWFNTETGEVFYVGKGCHKRYLERNHRNSKFKEYIEQNPVDVRIVINDLTEEEAFQKEKELYLKYKAIDQCGCNLMEAGQGGLGQIWTEEMREYWSINNPMKAEEQRQRMRDNNPMKNAEIAKKSGEKHKRAVVIDNVQYDSLLAAAQAYGVSDVTIGDWCRKGSGKNGIICSYADKRPSKRNPTSLSRPVIVDGVWYPSISQAAQAVGLSASSLGGALRNNRKFLKNHSCEYANQQPSQ